MAKRKKARESAAPSEPRERPAQPLAPIAVPALPAIITPEAAVVAREHPRAWLLLFAPLVLVVFASPAASDPWPVLITIGRVLVAIACAIALAARAPALKAIYARATPVAMLAPILAVLGAMALTGRADLPGRVYELAHPATFGIPTELAFVVLTLGLTRRAPLMTALGLGWATLSLAVPDVALAHSAWPFAHAHPLVTIGAVVHVAVLVAGWLVATRVVRDATSTRIVRMIAERAATIVGVTLAVTTLAADASPAVGLLYAALIIALPLLVTPVVGAFQAATPTSRSRRALALELLIGVVVLGLWFLVKSHALIASNTDENIYFYMAKLVASGKLPYSDFFFAHPPLHVLLPGLVFAIFGYSLTLAKLFSLSAAAVIGVGLWCIARRGFSPYPRRPSNELAPVGVLARATGLLAMTFFLFAAEPLKASSNMTGVTMTTAWLVMATLAYTRGRPLLAGLAAGAAATTGFYAMAAVMALLALALFRRPTPGSGARRFGFFLRQLLGFAIVFGALNLFFYAVAGDAYLESVYGYHQKKFFDDPAMVELTGGPIGFPGSLFNNLSVMTAGRDMTKEYFFHPHLWLAALALPVLAIGRWIAARNNALAFFDPRRLAVAGPDAPDGLAATLWLVALALFVEFALFREIYSFYFTLIYPFLAFVLASVITRGLGTLAASFEDLATRRRSAIGAVAALLAGVVVALHPQLALSTGSAFDDELTALGERNFYPWTPGPLGDVGSVVRPLFWSDHRIKGDVEPGYRHFLWSKKREFASLDAIASWVEAHSRPDESIAGASTLAPLIALAADRRIAAAEVDTNNKRFKTGLLTDEAYWTSICADNVKLIVSANRSYFTSDRMEGLATPKKYFRLAKVFEDTGLTYRGVFRIALYERIGDAPCRWEK